MSSRREPLLWLQCLAIGVIPLELLLLRLVLAGSDLGPVPGLERILAWAIGALAPAVFFWRRQPDWGSLLLVRLPQQGRSQAQHQLSRDLQTLPVRLIAAAGVLPLLIVLWWIDASALLVADLSPFSTGSRLGSLLLAAPLLTLLLWQWQQLVQATSLLIRSSNTASADSKADGTDLQESCLSLGLAILQLHPLDWAPAPPPQVQAEVKEIQTEAKVAEPSGPSDSDQQESEEQKYDPEASSTVASSAPATPASPTEAAESEPDSTALDSSSTADSPLSDQSVEAADPDSTALPLSGTIEPEQGPEQHDGTNLDEEVGSIDSVSSTEAETHHEETEPPRSEQSEPNQSSEPPPGSA